MVTIKKIAILVIVLFIVGGWALLLQQERQQASAAVGTGDLIRLHIVANSDSAADQQLKLVVRDAVVAYLSPQLAGVSTAAAAREVVAAQQENILDVVRQTLRAGGAGYPAALQIGRFDFPWRSYGALVLPAGRYDAVRIVLGQAQGANWWCVLFPPLCLVEGGAVATGSASPDAWQHLDRIEIRWKVAELWQELSDR